MKNQDTNKYSLIASSYENPRISKLCFWTFSTTETNGTSIYSSKQIFWSKIQIFKQIFSTPLSLQWVPFRAIWLLLISKFPCFAPTSDLSRSSRIRKRINQYEFWFKSIWFSSTINKRNGNFSSSRNSQFVLYRAQTSRCLSDAWYFLLHTRRYRPIKNKKS